MPHKMDVWSPDLVPMSKVFCPVQSRDSVEVCKPSRFILEAFYGRNVTPALGDFQFSPRKLLSDIMLQTSRKRGDCYEVGVIGRL